MSDSNSPKKKSQGQTEKDQQKQKLGKALREYYSEYFEVESIWNVIKASNFQSREFGFNRLDIGFTRNKSFEQISHLKEYLSTFPIAGSYIGSLYEDRLLPKTRHAEAITIHNSKWLGRELIFDLDLDEYDKVRDCKCKGRMSCEICWHLMQDASIIIDETLKDDFGFKERIWLYTGGRGYHCWVLDADTVDLSGEQRSAIIGYMQLIHDPKGQQKIDDLGNHAAILKERIYSKLAKKFITEATSKILREEIGFSYPQLKRAREKITKVNYLQSVDGIIPKEMEKVFLTNLIKYRYPRIDHKVTIDTRRLIRMPNSVHTGANNICRYLDDPGSFDPRSGADNLSNYVTI